jgi:hypothetical protein
MTHNQIEWWKLKETQRHNVVTEGISQNTLNESIRHNVQTEVQARNELLEQARHNQVSEAIGWGNLAETTRHNRESERLTWEVAVLDSNTRISVANIGAAATRDAAAINASATRYSAMLSNEAQHYAANKQQENVRLQNSNRFNIAKLQSDTSIFGSTISAGAGLAALFA